MHPWLVPLLDLLGLGGSAAGEPTSAPEVLVARDRGRTLAAREHGRALVARDDGRTLVADATRRNLWSGRWHLPEGAKRRLAISFEDFEEVEASETLSNPTAVVTESGSGITLSSVTVSGSEVRFIADADGAVVATADTLAEGGPGYTDYTVRVKVDTSGGAELVAEGTLRVEESG